MWQNRLRPIRRTRKLHAAGDEPLWSESWYFDFADPEQGVGGWVRLGLMPNESTDMDQRAAVRTRHADDRD